MIKNKTQKYLFFLLGVNLLFLYFYLVFGFFERIGFLFGVSFFLLSSFFWCLVLDKIFVIKEYVQKVVLAFLANMLILSFVSSIFIVFYKLDNFFIWLSCFLTSFFSVGIYLLVYKKKSQKKFILDSKEKLPNFPKIPWFKSIYLLLFVVAFSILYKANTGVVLFSPWQTINPWFAVLFFILTLFLGIFIFSKENKRNIIIFLILHSFLAHLYLPMSHSMPWGGDVWRHIAIEQKIVDNEQILPALFGDNVEWQEAFGADFPKVFFAPQKYSYGAFWGLNIILAKIFKSGLMFWHIWLMPIVWSLSVPILLFRIGSVLFKSKRLGLVLPWLTFIIFPFQALGALSLPVSLGFVGFLFTLFLWILYFDEDSKNKIWIKKIAILFSVLMFFGYALYFLILWTTLLAVFVYKLLKSQKRQVYFKIPILFLGVFVIPVIELIGKTSLWPKVYMIKDNLIQFVGQFSGWYFAKAIRPHDILSGNIFFNHTPDFAFVSSVFLAWRWYIIPVLLSIWIFTVLGFVCKINSKREKDFVILFLFSTVFGGYIIGWFFLEGDRQITRRLDILLAFLVLILFVYGIKYLYESNFVKKINSKTQQIILIGAVVVLSFFGTAVYSSGPDMRVVSWGEYNQAEFFWGYIQKSTDSYQEVCVLADTWVLLPLEAISSRQIIGGNFPIDNQFGQKELLEIYSGIENEPSEEVLDKIFMTQDYKKCYIIAEESDKNFVDFASKSKRMKKVGKDLSSWLWEIQR